MGFIMGFVSMIYRLPLLLFFAGTLLAFLLNLGVAGPMIQTDEGSYLANAAAIAGYSNDLASSHHAGYSVLLSPAFLFGLPPTQVWVLVKLINAVLYGSSLFCLWLVCQRLFPLVPARQRLICVGLVGLYPMWLVMAGYAFAQIAFVPGYLLVVVLFLAAVDAHTWVRTLALGVAAGGLYWIHSVAAPVIAALLLASVYWTVVSRRPAFSGQVFLGAALSLSVHRWLFQPWLRDRMNIGGGPERLHYPALGALLETMFTQEGLQRLVSVVGGHVFYLTVGTGGLIIFAVAYLVRWLPTAPLTKIADPQRSAASFLLLGSFAGVFLLSVIAMSRPQRLDHWMYGRYVEGVLAPMLLIALISTRKLGRHWPLLVSVVAAALLLSGLVGYGHTAPFNVSTFWQEFILRPQPPYVWLAAGIAVLAVLLYLPRRLIAGGLALFFAVNIVLQIKYHTINSKGARQRIVAGEVVRQTFPPGTCIGFDRADLNGGLKQVFLNDLGFFLYDYPMRRIDLDTWRKECSGPFFSFKHELPEIQPGLSALAYTPGGGPALFARVDDVPQNIIENYPLNLSSPSVAVTRLLGKGWHGYEPNNVWSTASAELNLPVPERCQRQRCRFILTLAPYGASPARPVEVWIHDSTRTAGQTAPALSLTSGATVELAVDVRDFPVQVLRIDVPSAISPSELRGSHDSRVLGIGLRAVDLQLID